MIKKILNNSLIMTWIDISVKFGMNVILLPIATIYLPPEELAFFLFFGSLLSMAYLAEGGINRVILRAVAYFKEGASMLPNNFKEINEVKSDGQINYKLLGQLIHTSFVIYLALGIISLIIFFTIGYFASENLISKQTNLVKAYITFLMLSVFAFLYIMQLRWVGLIQGLGHLSHQKRIEVSLGFARMVLVILAIVLGFGILGVAIAMIALVIVAHIVYKKVFYNYLPINSIYMYQYFSKDILKILIPSAWKQSVLSWGSFLIYQGTSLIVAQLDDVNLIASYMLTLQIINMLIQISNAPAYSYYPNISQAIVNRNKNKVKFLLFKSLKISLSIYSLGALIIYFFGNKSLILLGAKALLISGNLLMLMLFMYMLELHHVVHATIYTATNHIPFVFPALLSGAAIIVSGLIVKDNYGLAGIVVVQFFVQLSFNNWYPVWLNYRLISQLN